MTEAAFPSSSYASFELYQTLEIVLDFQQIGTTLVILKLDRKSKTPPTAFSSDLKEVSLIPMMTKYSFGPFLENFNLEDLSLAFFKTLEMFF